LNQLICFDAINQFADLSYWLVCFIIHHEQQDGFDIEVQA